MSAEWPRAALSRRTSRRSGGSPRLVRTAFIVWRSEDSELERPLAPAPAAEPRRAKSARKATRIFLLISIAGVYRATFRGSPPPKGVHGIRSERLFHRAVWASPIPMRVRTAPDSWTGARD